MINTKMNSDKTKIAIIGCGVMGSNHARIFDMLKNVTVIGVYDTNSELSNKLAEKYDCKNFTELEPLLEQADAISICAPTNVHHSIGMKALALKKPTLIEKPLAMNAQECEDLINIANKNNTPLMVGHIEQFNPVIQQLKTILHETKPRIYGIDVRRLSFDSIRIQDVDVVEDLMIHDLEIIISIIKDLPSDIVARGVVEDSGKGFGHIEAILTFPSGAVSSLTASRVTQNKIRRISLTTDHGQIEADYIDQTLEIYRRGNPTKLNVSQGNDNMELAMEKPIIRHIEPLYNELSHFADVANEGIKPLVDGKRAYEALKVVWEIQRNAHAKTNK